MEKLFKSKLAFIAFVILFTSFLAFFYKNSVSVALFSGLIGGLVGFIFAQWYWIEKMKDIQHLLDARMATPETAELLKRKEEELFKATNNNTKLLNIIGELQNELTALREAYKDVLADREQLWKKNLQAKGGIDVTCKSGSNTNEEQ